MKRNTIIFGLIVGLMVVASVAILAQPGSRPISTSLKDTGIYFEIEISSSNNPPMLWKNWRDAGMYYGESKLDKSSSMIIIRDGASFSLSPDIKVARKSKLELDVAKNPMASKYGPLADIPQIDPEKYVSLLNTLGARKQGPTVMPDGTKADMYSLDIPSTERFPWNKFVIWIDQKTQMPSVIEFMEGDAKRKLTFKIIEPGVKVDKSKFEVPEGYKLIVFEWD